MANTVAKTFKLEQETIDKLQGVIDATGLTWDGTFSMLASQYTAQQAAQATGRQTEMQDFTTLLSKISEAYASALAINANTDERIRTEYAHRIATSEEAVTGLKEKLAEAKAEASAAVDELKVAKTEIEALTAKTNEANDQAAKANDALGDKETLISMLKDENNNLKKQIEELSKQAKAGAEADAQRKRADAAEADVQKLKNDIEAARAEVRTAQTEAKAKADELKGRYEERLEIAADKAKNDRDAAVIAAKTAAAKEMDTLRDKIAELRTEMLAKKTEEKEHPQRTSRRKKTETSAE